nr:hypothetical protein 21 [bacterium]
MSSSKQNQGFSNPSVEQARLWEADGLRFEELIFQPYENLRYSAGKVYGSPGHQVYLMVERIDEGQAPRVITHMLLSAEELASIAWVATGTLWSHLVDPKDADGFHTNTK